MIFTSTRGLALKCWPLGQKVCGTLHSKYFSNMVKVKVDQGWLEGERLVTVTGEGHYYSFKGIPYAAPPLGKLRFKAPESLKNWDGVRKAFKHGPECPQKDIFTGELIPGSEDCLYLNVYTPDIKPEKRLPVMVFIHGGGYKSGSGNVDNYGPDFLVSHGVILVTINYRLEVFGFLCLDTEEVPGNAGMKDQVAALGWVANHIEHFGGDPSNVTVFGESAGGASTALHVLSRMTCGRINKAIAMSGVPFCDFSIAFEPRRRAFVLGRELGLDTDDPNQLLEFLQSLPAEKLVDVHPHVLSSEEVSNNVFKMYPFTPVVEKDFGLPNQFLTEDPVKILKKGLINNVDLMIGYTDQEALIGIPFFEKIASTYNKYPEVLVPRKILIESTPSKILLAADMIREFYFGKKPIGVESMKEAVTYLSESCFTYDIDKFIKNLPNLGHKNRYLYRFSCVSDRNVYSKDVAKKYGMSGAGHLEDLMYLFDPKKFNLPIDKESREYKMIQQTCTLFTNFAKYADPTPDASLGVKWPKYDKETQAHLDIGEQLTPGKALQAESVAFWKKVYDTVGIDYL